MYSDYLDVEMCGLMIISYIYQKKHDKNKRSSQIVCCRISHGAHAHSMPKDVDRMKVYRVQKAMAIPLGEINGHWALKSVHKKCVHFLAQKTPSGSGETRILVFASIYTWNIYIYICEDFHSHGGTPSYRWFISAKIPI